MRFIQDLPFITTQMPVCPDGTDISVSYYFFNKTDDKNIAVLYCQEILYAYRQLITHTNILDCGRVRFFVDRRWEDVAREQFGNCGLESLISIIDVHEGVHLAGYIPHLNHEHVRECRYRFHADADLWWISNDGEVFDWQAFCETLDKTDDNCIYAQPIEKTECDLQTNYAQFAPDTDRKRMAEWNLRKIFGISIPLEFRSIVNTAYQKLVKENTISKLRCIGGWFVGVRQDSQALFDMLSLYELTNDFLTDDEGFFAILLHLNPYPDLNIDKVLQGTGDPLPHEIKHAALDNYKGMKGVGVINIGTQPFYDPQMEAKRKELAELFSQSIEIDFENNQDAETPPVVDPDFFLNAFGEHIVGTYALDTRGKEFALMSHSNGFHGNLFGFASAFRPLRNTNLPTDFRTDEPEIVVFYCISYHPEYYTHELHVYAKSMVYAYKQLLMSTNIRDMGKVYFYVDRRCLDTVYPYCKEANIAELVVPYDSDKNIHYASYIPCYWDEHMENARYRLYFDVDVWWINLHSKPEFDFGKMIEDLDEQGDGVISHQVTKSAEEIAMDIYKRCVFKGDTHPEKLKSWMHDNFGNDVPADHIKRSLSGCYTALPNGETLNKVRRFYNEVGDMIRDDEGFWTIFLSKYPEVNIINITQHMTGVGFKRTQVAQHDRPQIINTGTYMFEHFFNNPEAELLFHHINKPIYS